jgi:hypothetical protein
MARSDRKASASRVRTRSATPTLLSLPEALQTRILGGLPVDARLSAAGVCRGWRAALKSRQLWSTLDLSHSSGVARVTSALLLAASARAGKRLRKLNLSRAPGGPNVPFEILEQCAADNSAALVELRVDGTCIDDGFESLSSRQVADLLAAAPRLQHLYADVRSGAYDEPEYDDDDQAIEDEREAVFGRRNADQRDALRPAPHRELHIHRHVSPIPPRLGRGVRRGFN